MSQRLPRPATSCVAVNRAASLVDDHALGNPDHGYVWGTGSFHAPPAPDLPWSTSRYGTGCDCYGLIAWAYKLPRHRTGYNAGRWATITDDQNCDSAIEDSEHERDLWTPAVGIMPGDILVWSTLHEPAPRIGHVCLVESVRRVLEWDDADPSFELLDVIQVCGGPGRKPAAIRTSGTQWRGRDHHHGLVDPKWRSRILRAVP